jgi:phosphoenolpyruvate phosphomutase
MISRLVYAGCKRTTLLKEMLAHPLLDFFMEAHSGISAVIVEDVGFKGIWASSLTISAQLGVRDYDEASWTQVLEVLEFMAARTIVPILVDAGSGYGNFNNARRFAKKLEQRGIAGVCYEDRPFPKASLLEVGEHALLDISEFQRKIEACKAAVTDPDFQIVAKVEALVAGYGLDEAIQRSEAYRQAGADAILIQSNRSDLKEIEEFVQAWDERHPLILVPSKYYETPTDTFRDWGISAVIWEDHNLRASIDAMKEVSKELFETQSIVGVEHKLRSVNEVFRLQGRHELVEDEKKYL